MLVERAKEWVEQWKREGLEQGLERGLERGRALGRKEGLEQGLEQGKLRGEAHLLLRLLERKFGAIPDELTTRVLDAGFDELDLWGARVLDARTLDEVFGD